MSSEQASKTILEGIELDPEQYRLGHTKVYILGKTTNLINVIILIKHK